VCIEEAEEIVNSLPDKELYEMLITLGKTIGPVVATTRPVYKLMLRNLLTGHKSLPEPEEASTTTTNGSGNGVNEAVDLGNGHGEEYSDSDREIDTPKDTPRTTRASGNSEFEDYFLSYVDARQGAQRNSEVDAEKRKVRSSSRQTSTPRRESSPATSAAAAAAERGTPPKFALPKLAEKDTPMPTLFRKVTGTDSTPPATYRRTPTPNPELTRRNLAPRSLDLEPEPTALKRKTIKKPEAGKSTNGNNQSEVDYSPYTGPNVGVLFAIFAILTLSILGFIWYTFSPPAISQEEIEDVELDKLLQTLE